MVIAIEARGVAYAPVPKAGCTSVKMMLSRIDPGFEPSEHAATSGKLFHKRYRTQRFKHVRWQKYRDAFCFTVVRDPLKRLLAVYTNRVLQRRELETSPNLKHRRVDLPIDPDPDYFFQNLRAYMQAVSPIKHHALPTSLFTGPDLDRYHRVFRTEEMPDLADTLSRLTGQEVAAPHANGSGVKLTLDDLQPKTRAMCATYLEPEYGFLRDYFDNPFA